MFPDGVWPCHLLCRLEAGLGRAGQTFQLKNKSHHNQQSQQSSWQGLILLCLRLPCQVFSLGELEEVCALAVKHDVLVIADDV